MSPPSPRHAPVRRSLVLTSEGARHPFRQSLPPHVYVPHAEPRRRRSLREVLLEDWKSFAGTYCATFVAVSLFVA
jgi:hypothetical protein